MVIGLDDFGLVVAEVRTEYGGRDHMHLMHLAYCIGDLTGSVVQAKQDNSVLLGGVSVDGLVQVSLEALKQTSFLLVRQLLFPSVQALLTDDKLSVNFLRVGVRNVKLLGGPVARKAPLSD